MPTSSRRTGRARPPSIRWKLSVNAAGSADGATRQRRSRSRTTLPSSSSRRSASWTRPRANPSSRGEGDLAGQEVAGVEPAHEVEDPVVDLDERRDAVADVAPRLLVRGHVTTASSAAATSSRNRSAPCGATSCTPTGSPALVRPNGTEIAGQPVTVTR